MHDLIGFQRDALYIIAGMDSPKGLAIKEKLDDYYASEINHGRLYPNLDALIEMDLVEKGEIDDRTNSYTLTEEGKDLLAYRREWEEETARTSS